MFLHANLERQVVLSMEVLLEKLEPNSDLSTTSASETTYLYFQLKNSVVGIQVVADEGILLTILVGVCFYNSEIQHLFRI